MARARSFALLLFCVVACSNARTGHDEDCDLNDASCSQNEEHDGETLLQVLSDAELSAKAIEPVVHTSLSQHGATGAIADALTAAKEALERQIENEQTLLSNAQRGKKSAEEEKGRKDSEYERDCTWSCSGFWSCLDKLKVWELVTSNCKDLDQRSKDLGNSIIPGYAQQIKNAEDEIARLTPLKTAKLEAATAALELENSITAKEGELTQHQTLLSTAEANNANEQRSKKEQHEALVDFLNAHISDLQASAASVKAEYDLLTESHTSTECSQKNSSAENICHRCSEAAGQKPCHNECIASEIACYKDAGCACQEASLLASSEASLKNDKNHTHSLNQVIQNAKQEYGEAITKHNLTIHSLAAEIVLKEQAIAEQEATKQAAIGELDAKIEDEERAQEALKLEKTAAEARMADSEQGLADALAKGEADVTKLGTELAAELERLANETSSTQANREARKHDHATELEVLQDKHTIAENAVKATITQLEADKANLESALQGIKDEHLPA